MEEKLTSEPSTIVIPAALDLESVVGSDEGCGVLIQPDTYGKRVIGQCCAQAPQAVALREMLIDDEAVGEAETGRELHASADRRGALVTGCNHVLAQNAGAR